MTISLARKVIFACVPAFLLCLANAYAQGPWVPLTNPAPSQCGGVMILLSDGTVLAKNSAGGGVGNSWDRLTPDIHGSYINGTWSNVDTMFEERNDFPSKVLKDGRVYVAGGEHGYGNYYVELFNPRTGHWVPAPMIGGGADILDFSSEILEDGRIIQAVYTPDSFGCDFFDPAINLFVPGPSPLRNFDEATWVKLPDNSILYVDEGRQTSERYIPSLNMWVDDGVVPVPLYDTYDDEIGPGFVLPDGRAIFFGSVSNTAYYTPSGTSSPGTWAAGPNFPGGQGMPDAAGAMMVNGKILLTTSLAPYGTLVYPSPTSVYEFDYLTNTFTSVGAPGGATTIPGACGNANMLDLPDGTVLFGLLGDLQYFEYVPSGSPVPAGKPTIDNIYKVTCDTYMITGTLFNGLTEGADYGDDWQMETNYPIVRLMTGDTVYYAFSFDWNSTGIQRFGKHDTAYFVLPAGIPPQSYNVEVVANGNPSAPHPFTPCFIALNTRGNGVINADQVYPNPVAGVLNINGVAANTSYQLLTITGVVISQGALQQGSNTLPTTGMTPGIYILELTGDDGQRSFERIIKQ